MQLPAVLSLRGLSRAVRQQLPNPLAAHHHFRQARRQQHQLTFVDCTATSDASANPSAMPQHLEKRIGFMGAGQMAEALARGLIDKGVIAASNICCSDPTPARKELFKSLGATPFDTNLEVRSCRRRLLLPLLPLQDRRPVNGAVEGLQSSLS
jgi:hypothetical protein